MPITGTISRWRGGARYSKDQYKIGRGCAHCAGDGGRYGGEDIQTGHWSSGFASCAVDAYYSWH